MSKADQPKKLVRDAKHGTEGMDKALREFNRHFQTLTFALLALDVDVPNLIPQLDLIRELQGKLSIPLHQIDEQLDRWYDAL